MDFAKELLVVVFIALVPTVPVAVLAWAMFRRRRGVAHPDVAAGRAPETPFAALSVVGLVITVVVVFVLALTIAARLLA